VVETATYGSEFMVARQATEQIMDLHYTLRMLRIPLDGPAWLFGDNQSVITSSTIPHSNLNKCHNALSYHRVREAISAKVMYFIHIDGKLNPSDVMTKFLGWTKFWPLIQPFLFWKGETIKGATNNTTMTEVISMIKDQSPSGLRGVTRGNSDKVNPSGEVNHGNNDKVKPSVEVNPKVNSNNDCNNGVKDFIMVQPEKDNPKENPLPSLPGENTKVRFLLPVTQKLSAAQPEPPILPVIQEVMEGAHDMDEHFFQAPLRDNMPVILGLLGVWNSTFLGCSCRAIIPYSQALCYFPSYVQYIDMEGNGKRVAMDGSQLLHRSGEVTFGGAASTCQYTFFQSLHQGRVVPADFIGFMESPKEIELPTEAVSNHDELMSNFFAQPDGLAYGKTLVDLIQEGTPEPLREHMVFTGNRPSSSILMTRLDAFSIGQLIALYEHRSAVQGFIWGINSFDSFGNDLGTTLAKHVRAQLSAETPSATLSIKHISKHHGLKR
jgi:Phosphoglucose isomerase